MVKIPIKCTLDNLKEIVALRLKTNLTSDLIRILAWFGVLSCHVLHNVIPTIWLSDMTQIFMFQGWYLCIVRKSFYYYSWLISSHSFWYATQNIIHKSWTKVNVIRIQSDSNVFYNTLQSTYKLKSALTIFYSQRISGF